jgi:hypothetical protein
MYGRGPSFSTRRSISSGFVDGALHALAEETTEIRALALGPDQDLKDGAQSVAAMVRVKLS